MMQGLQEGVRGRAWNIKNSTNTLKPLKDMARTAFNGSKNKKPVDDFTDHHFSENADELDFEKIISLADEKPAKNLRNQDSPPPSQGEHPFDLSNFMQDDTPNYISDGDINGKNELDSSFSDHSLANEIALHQTNKK